MKVGDLIRMITDRLDPQPNPMGVLIGCRRNPRSGRRIGKVLTHRGFETWPLDSHYEYEVISESR